MSTVSLLLRRKTERIEASPKGFIHSLTFEAHLPLKEKLMSHAGEVVAQGYVEIRKSQPRFSTPTLMFSKAMVDPDTGKTFPPSISFYALVPEDIFSALLNAPAAATYTLILSTELLGAIRFNDLMGFEKVWNIEEQNPVAVPHFDFAVVYDGEA